MKKTLLGLLFLLPAGSLWAAAPPAAEKGGAERHTYAQRMEEELDALDMRIEQLGAQANQMRKDERRDLDRRLRVLRRKERKVEDRLEALERSSGEAWRDFKESIDALVQDLKEDLHRTDKRQEQEKKE